MVIKSDDLLNGAANALSVGDKKLMNNGNETSGVLRRSMSLSLFLLVHSFKGLMAKL